MIRIRIRLSALLGERRMKQKELSDLTGISATTINHYYHEATDRVSVSHLEAICEALNCDVDELIVQEIIDEDVSCVADLRWERETRRKAAQKNRT